MKKTLTTVLIFAAVLAALLGAAELVERLAPQAGPAEAEEKTVANEMNASRATAITLSDDGVSFLGVGAGQEGGVVTIRYPGTYRLTGALTDGQLVVDLGDYNGAVYLIMDGVSVACTDGPALYVKQADLTVLYLESGTVNTLRDGEDYVIVEKQEEQSGAAVYSCDDLRVEGAGTLIVGGSSADGIRSKDGLAIAGGVVNIYSMDDGLQGSDYVEISGGYVTVGTYGDGISTTEGYVEISGGTVLMTPAGDGVSAATELNITGGTVEITAHGGPSYYPAVATADMSAKGLKAQDIHISGGSVLLSTADDGVHALNDLTVTGGRLAVASGDDALMAKNTLTVSGGDIDITESYEGFDAETVRLVGITASVVAANNGADAGEGGFSAENVSLAITAPRAVSCDGTLTLRGGSLDITADGTDSLFKYADIDLAGTGIVAYAGSNDAALLTEKGSLPHSLLFQFREPVAAGTRFTLTDALGNTLAEFSRDAEAGAVLIASGAFKEGESYTLAVAEPAAAPEATDEAAAASAEPVTMTGTVGALCTAVEPEGGLIVQLQSGWGGFPGGPGGGFPGMPGGRP